MNESIENEQTHSESTNILSKHNQKREIIYLWDIWNQNPPYTLFGNCALIGYSIAALRSNFLIKSLKIMFDAGLSVNYFCEYIFLTHTHSDHSASLQFHIFSPNIKVYVPYTWKEKVDKFLEASHIISADTPFDKTNVEYQIIGIKPNDEWEIIANKKPFKINSYACDHSIDCLAYGFSEKIKYLKEEYKSLAGNELGKLRKNGIIIEDYKYIPRFIYIGDTTEEVLKKNTNIFMYPIIIIECTFLLEEDLNQARETKHCHWITLRPYIIEHPECMFILYHFSQRYKPNEIEEFFKINHLNNIYPWISK